VLEKTTVPKSHSRGDPGVLGGVCDSRAEAAVALLRDQLLGSAKLFVDETAPVTPSARLSFPARGPPNSPNGHTTGAGTVKKLLRRARTGARACQACWLGWRGATRSSTPQFGFGR
jgi:hypothetical protein